MEKYNNYFKKKTALLVAGTVSIIGLAMLAGGLNEMTNVHKTTVHPQKTVMSKSARPRQLPARHIGKYVFYKDFTNPRAWVSQRSHGKFRGSTCESAAILTGLRLEGLAKNINLYNFTKDYVGFPNTPNGKTSPYLSYDRNPYIHHGASVYSQPIAQAALKAGSRVAIINNTSTDTIVNYLKQGHPVYVEAGHHMDCIWHGKLSDHTSILAGIRQDRNGNTQVRYMDPNSNTYKAASGWCPLQKFLIAWHRPTITGMRAVVLLGRMPKQDIPKQKTIQIRPHHITKQQIHRQKKRQKKIIKHKITKN